MTKSSIISQEAGDSIDIRLKHSRLKLFLLLFPFLKFLLLNQKPLFNFLPLKSLVIKSILPLLAADFGYIFLLLKLVYLQHSLQLGLFLLVQLSLVESLLRLSQDLLLLMSIVLSYIFTRPTIKGLFFIKIRTGLCSKYHLLYWPLFIKIWLPILLQRLAKTTLLLSSNKTGLISSLIQSLKNVAFIGFDFILMLTNISYYSRFNKILESESHVGLLRLILKGLLLVIEDFLGRILLSFRSFFEPFQKADNILCKRIDQAGIKAFLGDKFARYQVGIRVSSQIY